MSHPSSIVSALSLFSTLVFWTACVADEQPANSTDAPAKITEQQVEFVRIKVLPLLEARCFECHKNGKENKGGLLLSSRTAMLKGGDSGAAIVPGKPNESLLIESIRYESFEMPPRSRMPDAEIAILEKWVADGAPWPADLNSEPTAVEAAFPLEQRKQSHWAWQQLADPAAPKVIDADWCRDALDAFVLAKLEAEELKPATDADRRTLIRRLYFDIVGLPPSIAQIEAFVNDPQDIDAALATVADELLQSPHFGERWGRHWLDLVRYAETLGHEFDYPLHNAWRYRDYVIRALNADVPYDDFVREHVAGDLLPQPRQHPTQQFNESVIGTGFWFLSEGKHAPVDVRGEEASTMENQIDVFSRTFLGMTVACARCHDHKFDAISTKDYYALAGFLQSSRRQTAWLDPNNAIQQQVRKLKHVRAEAGRILASHAVADATSDEIRKYVLAALETIHGQPSDAEIAAKASQDAKDIVFADFEAESFGDWQAEGEAFAAGTATGTWPGQQQVSGFQGDRLVNSWIRSDDFKGTLRSPEFTVERSHISFLIGGGAYKNTTCVNLVVDGKSVRTATGQNKEPLNPHTWDVTELLGKVARIEIIDQQTGAWGHINADHFVFQNASSTPATRRSIAAVAEERQCDPQTLHSWVVSLLHPESRDVEDCLSLLATVAQTDTAAGTPDSRVKTALSQWTTRVRKRSVSAAAAQDRTTPFADLRRGVPDGWFTTGDAFTSMATTDQPDLQWGSGGLQLNNGDGVSSANLSKELRGTLSSPTFTLQHPEILVRVAGEGSRMRLVIDGYVMNEFNGLLFSGTKQDVNTEGKFQWVRFAGDVHRYMGHSAHLEFLDEGSGWIAVQEVCFANSPGAAPPNSAVNPLNETLLVNSADADVNSAQTMVDVWLQALIQHPNRATTDLFHHRLLPRLNADEQWKQLSADFADQAERVPGPIPVLAMTEGSPENERIFIRGNHRNLGEVAERNILTALQAAPVDFGNSSGRLELAEQMVAEHNPLTARVAVNRIWHHLFGTGIVESTDNLGVLGKLPTHPELLDHLASRFRTDGWSVKKMIRTLVLSRSYRMSSDRNELAEQKDPVNDLLHRARIRRLQGEAVRDAILTVSGRLDRTLFGPPVPVHLTAFMQGRGRPGNNGPLDGSGRRSIYISVNRNFLSPFMQAFDVPAPVTTIGRRTTSNVPAQALIMLNNEFVNQQSQNWATRLLADAQKSTNDVLGQAWYELFGRPAEPEELQVLFDFAAASFVGAEQKLSKASLTEICHVLLNSKEFMFLR